MKADVVERRAEVDRARDSAQTVLQANPQSKLGNASMQLLTKYDTLHQAAKVCSCFHTLTQ